MTSPFTESVVEDAALAWLESLGYAIKHGPEARAGNLFKRTDRGKIVPEDRERELVQNMQQLKEKAMCKKCNSSEWPVTVSGKEIVGRWAAGAVEPRIGGNYRGLLGGSKGGQVTRGET